MAKAWRTSGGLDFDPPSQPAATNTTLTNNTFRSNRTDICDESASTGIGAGNVCAHGGSAHECTVEPGLVLEAIRSRRAT